MLDDFMCAVDLILKAFIAGLAFQEIDFVIKVQLFCNLTVRH